MNFLSLGWDAVSICMDFLESLSFNWMKNVVSILNRHSQRCICHPTLFCGQSNFIFDPNHSP